MGTGLISMSGKDMPERKRHALKLVLPMNILKDGRETREILTKKASRFYERPRLWSRLCRSVPQGGGRSGRSK
jgi:hypothetical protein